MNFEFVVIYSITKLVRSQEDRRFNILLLDILSI